MTSQSKISLWDHGAKYMACFELCAPFPSPFCEDEFGWNLTERERLTLYYNSVEELGRLACFKGLFFRFEQEVASESSRTRSRRFL